MELRRLDGIDKCKLLTLDHSRATYVATYERFLQNDCKISFRMYGDKESKVLKWRDLTDSEKRKVFKQIDIPHLFPRLSQATNLQAIWMEFREIHSILQSTTPLNDDGVKILEDRIRKWMFLSVYQTKHVTPYMHLLVSHIPQFLQLYSTIAPISQQGLEKLNDDLTKDYFRSTNHRDSDALKQRLLKLNRIEELSDRDCSRTKQIHVCKVCKCAGHNACTCEQKHELLSARFFFITLSLTSLSPLNPSIPPLIFVLFHYNTANWPEGA